KQPHAKQPVASVRPGYLTRRATQEYSSNIPKFRKRTLAQRAYGMRAFVIDVFTSSWPIA
ncbi:hypothetical protein NQ227_25325, partial [Escherichia coli]|nr:hypothetical protein [Escherichia coli]